MVNSNNESVSSITDVEESLIGRIINIQSRPEQFEEPGERIAYKIGHRDARHGVWDFYQENPDSVENMSIDWSIISGYSDACKNAYVFGFNEAKREAISIIKTTNSAVEYSEIVSESDTEHGTIAVLSDRSGTKFQVTRDGVVRHNHLDAKGVIRALSFYLHGS